MACDMHKWREHRDCERERKAWRACVKRGGKSADYTWKLWHEPRPKARKCPATPIRPHPTLGRALWTPEQRAENLWKQDRPADWKPWRKP